MTRYGFERGGVGDAGDGSRSDAARLDGSGSGLTMSVCVNPRGALRRLGSTEEGSLPFAFSASSRPGIGVREAWMLFTLAAFSANTATRTAPTAALPTGV